MGEVNSYRAIRALWVTMRILGMDPPEKYRVLYQVYSICLNTTITFYYPLSMFINMFLLDKKKEVVSNLTLTISMVVCGMKTFNNYLKRKELWKMREYLVELDSYLKFEADKEYLQYIVKVSLRYFILYASMYGLVIASCELPMVFSTESRLLYPAWFPWDWRNSTRIYVAIHTYQFVGISIQIYQNLLNDTLPGILMWLLKGHLHILKSRIQRIGYDKNLSTKKNYNELVACIKSHKICFE
ncbi:unnamed protein product [Hermetia illucens]|uniref:Odorant receptor n=2 Tax=Hermetia illucens TaxID=343691 RepID=A0A7R8UTL6_HERIL|nr:unnamed protein product [Hermetia illucens]